MNICMLAHHINPPWDEGTKNNVIRLSKALATFGNKIHILTTLDEKSSFEERIGSIEIHRIPLFDPKSSYFDKTRCFLFRSVREIEEYVDNVGFSVLHVHLYPSLLTFLGLSMLKLTKRIPIVQTVHAQPRHMLDQMSRKHVRMGLLIPNIVTVSSIWLRNQLVKCGVPNGKIRRVKMGVFLDDYVVECSNKKIEQFGFTQDDVVILYGSGIGVNRGDLLMLHALQKVCEKVKNAKCLFNARQKYGEQTSHRFTLIRKKIREMNLHEHVRLMGVREDMAEIYNMSHMLVMPLTSAIAKLDYPLTIIEGFAKGVPVIATSVGAIPELVVNKYNGLLIPPGDVDLLAHAIVKLIRNPKLANILGKNARRFAEENFDMYSTARRFERIYRYLGEE